MAAANLLLFNVCYINRKFVFNSTAGQWIVINIVIIPSHFMDLTLLSFLRAQHYTSALVTRCTQQGYLMQLHSLNYWVLQEQVRNTTVLSKTFKEAEIQFHPIQENTWAPAVTGKAHRYGEQVFALHAQEQLPEVHLKRNVGAAHCLSLPHSDSVSYFSPGAGWDASTLLSSAIQIPSKISLLVDSALLYHANKDIDGPILVIKGKEKHHVGTFWAYSQ